MSLNKKNHFVRTSFGLLKNQQYSKILLINEEKPTSIY